MITGIEVKALPRLAWLAKIDKSSLEVVVHHGIDVEVGPGYVIEGVWSGKFEDKDILNAHSFFGSAIQIIDNDFYIIPSTAIVDRILIGYSDECYFVSNSIVVILALTGSSLDKDHNYKIQADALFSGTKNYQKDIPILSSKISKLEQYFKNPIKIDSVGLHTVKDKPPVQFSNFNDYIDLIDLELGLIFENANSTSRSKKLKPYTTISTGYDSAAVTSLCVKYGIERAYTKKYSNASLLKRVFSKNAIDDGSEIANILGVDVEYLDINQSKIGEDELYFLAASAADPEIVFYKLCKDMEGNFYPNMVFTGYHGDKLWEREVGNKYLVDDIIRGDMSGLNPSEARLYFGFINIPIPLMFADSILCINSISNSKEMDSWKLHNNYDRPIPRRLLESKGVPGNMFGNHKKAVISYYNEPKNKFLKVAFRGYLGEEYNLSIVKMKWKSILDEFKYFVKMAIHKVGQKFKIKLKRPLSVDSLGMSLKLNIWATNKLAASIASKVSRELE